MNCTVSSDNRPRVRHHRGSAWLPVTSCGRGGGTGGPRETEAAQEGRGKLGGEGARGKTSGPAGAGAPEADTDGGSCCQFAPSRPNWKMPGPSSSMIHLRCPAVSVPTSFEEFKTEILCNSYAKNVVSFTGLPVSPCGHQARGWKPTETPSHLPPPLPPPLPKLRSGVLSHHFFLQVTSKVNQLREREQERARSQESSLKVSQ